DRVEERPPAWKGVHEDLVRLLAGVLDVEISQQHDTAWRLDAGRQRGNVADDALCLRHTPLLVATGVPRLHVGGVEIQPRRGAGVTHRADQISVVVPRRAAAARAGAEDGLL